VLTEIANRGGDPKGLAEAVALLRESLKVRTRAAAPLAFASSQNNLGYALVRLGEFQNEPGHFKEAIGCFRSALEVWTRETVPSRWSIAQQNLGDALAALGRSERRTDHLDEAAAAYADTLKERDRNHGPLAWASVQAALGNIYFQKAEWGSATEFLETSINHYRDALQQYPKTDASFARSGIEFHLGTALRILGERTANAALVSEALEHHALACRNCLPHNPYWALRAAEAADQDIEILKAMSDSTTIAAVLANHVWISTLWHKHAGHSIGLKAIFKAVVPGRSGRTKPDFSRAVKKGDRIKDGTVVWENGGKYTYCVQCEEFLLPSDQKAARQIRDS
jgi:tetratricopeptide (TPR) repeat protein